MVSQAEGSGLRLAVVGAGHGLVATVAMSGAMGMWQAASRRTRVPPALVTDRLLAAAGIQPSSSVVRKILEIGGHLGFGAAVGAAYLTGTAALLRRVPAARRVASTVTGPAYGIAVWAVFYGGLLPALGVLPTPPKDDHGRQHQLLATHMIYGLSLGLTTRHRPARPATGTTRSGV